jgi:hypothetical protein
VLLPELTVGKTGSPAASAAADGAALGFGGSYTAPSAAGLSHRVYSKTQSCTDMNGRSGMQPALAVAQQQHSSSSR